MTRKSARTGRFVKTMESSSFGTFSAVAARNSVTRADAARVVERANRITSETRSSSAPQNRPGRT